jgi:hypothetical protein
MNALASLGSSRKRVKKDLRVGSRGGSQDDNKKAKLYAAPAVAWYSAVYQLEFQLLTSTQCIQQELASPSLVPYKVRPLQIRCVALCYFATLIINDSHTLQR